MSNHPFLLVGDEYQPSNWIHACRSDHKFALSRVSCQVPFEQTPNVTVTREKAGAASRSVYYINGFKEWHQLPVLVNEGYQYTYAYDSLPYPRRIDVNMQDATAGDWYVARFKDFGKLGGLSLASTQGSFPARSSLSYLRSATSSGYFVEPNGDLYIKAVATGTDQSFRMSWTKDFLPPLVERDGFFFKPGNNGTATCSQFCEGAVWGEVGGCVGAVRTDNNERMDCFSAPGFLGDYQLTCQCERGFIKPGNDGTVSCGTFCDGEVWGRVGRCVGAVRADNGERLTCDQAPGYLGGHQLTCQCVPKVVLE